MKSPAFDYIRAESPQHVYELLERHGDEARLLAGGQTLLATLNMRLSQPVLVVDIGALDALRGISVDNGTLRIGALTRHAEIEDSALVARHAPLLAQAAPHIAHRAIRNLGTIGGALSYADPAAEWPACVLALGGTLVLASRQGERRVAAQDFFHGLYTTAMKPGELLLACELPCVRAGELQVFGELARRRGDYAIAGLAACRVGHLQHRHALAGADEARLAIANRPVARLVDQRRGPELEIEAGGDEEIGFFEHQRERGLRFDEVGVLVAARDGLGFDAVAAHELGDGRVGGKSRDDAHGGEHR